MGAKLLSDNRKNLIILAAVAAGLVLCVSLIGAFIFNSLSTLVYESSSESLEETYREVTQTYDEVSEARWNYLTQLGSYIAANGAENARSEVDRMQQSETYSFSEFYLLADNGQYRTLSGQRGYVDLGDNLFSLFDDGSNIVADGSLPNRDHMVFYAVPVQQGEYDGFTYSAIAFGYNNDAINQLFNVRAYDGQSTAYMAYKNGRVAFSMGTNTLNVDNVFPTLNSCEFENTDAETVKAKIQNDETDTVVATLDGQRYYVSFLPSTTQDMNIVSFTPTIAVDGGTTSISAMLMVGMAIILVIVLVVVIATIAFQFRRIVKERESQLVEKNELFAAISEDMDSVYFLFNASTHDVRYVTPNVEPMLGLTEQEIYDDVNVLAKCDLAQDAEAGAIDTIGSVSPGETKYAECTLRNLKTGVEMPFSSRIYRPEDSNIIVCVLSDGTEEARVRNAIENSLEAAKVANASKSNFLSNMSHDIRTPMNAIIGFTTLLQQDPNDPEKVKEYTQKIAASSQHLLALINDVLDISKIEAGKTTLDLERVDMTELVSSVVDMMRPQADAKHLSLQVNLDEAGTTEVMADRLRLNQILTNILSNAVKYTPDGGRVDVYCQGFMRTDGNIMGFRYTVSDSGIGMSEEFMKDLFSPFSRENTEQVRTVQGTGLGMAITKNLVDLMGGTIDVSSVLGEGSTFEVILEFRVAEGESADSDVDEVDDATLEGLHILAAEDNELNAEILQELLSLEGATCTVVTDGQKAVDAFNSSDPGTYDLILMDIQMPVMDGYDATRAIRSGNHPEAKTMPIVAMTANAFSEDVARALASGMNAHLAKPIDMDVLKKTLGEVLQGGGSAGRSKARMIPVSKKTNH